MRAVALWFPDWPLQAAALAAGTPPVGGAAAVVEAGRVKACTPAARAAGVRRGMRLRQARALAPGLAEYPEDEGRSARHFEPIAAGLDEVAPAVEILRPGLVAVGADAPARFHGGEETAVEKLLDAAARSGVDSQAGAADETPTAVLAARAGVLVPRGGSRRFLAPLPVAAPAEEPALGADAGVAARLADLGVGTLGALAALPAARVAARFGAAGARLHAIASGADERRVAAREQAPDYSVSARPEEPIVRVDAAAFVARQLAARLHERLAAAGLACHTLLVAAETTTGEELARRWRTYEPLSEAATADRVRWQLEGWLSAGGGGGIVALELGAAETADPGAGPGLWGGGGAGGAGQAAARAAGIVGTGAVLQPVPGGGRGVAERVAFHPHGERAEPAPAGPWPGRILGPLPARLGPGIRHPAAAARLLDAAGRPVSVTAEALLDREPAALGVAGGRYAITSWAGPWPEDDEWWGQTPIRVARLEAVGHAEGDERPRGWLLAWWRRGWRVEATYD